MNKTNTISIEFNAKVKSFEKLNDQFTLAKCLIHGIGKNRNLSHFSKENVLRNLKTIYNIPVVGHLIEDETGKLYMGSHDMEIKLTEEGLTFKDLTVPFGVVPYQDEDTLHFEDITEPDGTVVTYLVGQVILWTGRYPELLDAIYDEKTYFNESMEIDWEVATPLADDRNYMDIIDYTYSALCLLGKSNIDDTKNFEPCFPSSCVEPYKFALSKNEFSTIMGELKKELAFCFENIKKGGNEKLKLTQEKISEILLEYEVVLEDLDFEISDDISEDDFKLKLDELKKKRKKCSKCEVFAATYQQKREALSNACDSKFERDDNGEIISSVNFWVQDFDDTFVYVERNFYSDDNSECKHGRFAYTYNKADMTATLTSEFEEMVVTWLTLEENEKLEKSRNAFSVLQTDFDNYKKAYSTPDTEVAELQKFKTSRLSDDHTAEIKLALSEFEDLNTVEDFINLEKTAAETFENVEDLKEKCYAIRGKNTPAKFSAKPNKPNPIKLPIGNSSGDTDDEPYGGIFNEFGKRK
ncbi:MAG: hypothetical protein RR806_03185 [Oscillospiraceae bacterium]